MTKNNIKLYGNEFNRDVVKDINEINKKIEETQDPNELLQLRIRRLYRGMELNAGQSRRNLRGYYPY